MTSLTKTKGNTDFGEQRDDEGAGKKGLSTSFGDFKTVRLIGR
jgi:hypothetical protein